MDSLQLSTSQCHLLAWMQNCGLDPGPMPLPSASTLPQLFKQARGIDEKFLFVFLTNTDKYLSPYVSLDPGKILCLELIPVNHSPQAELLCGGLTTPA